MTLKVLYPIDETMSNATRILMLGFLLSPRAWQSDMINIDNFTIEVKVCEETSGMIIYSLTSGGKTIYAIDVPHHSGTFRESKSIFKREYRPTTTSDEIKLKELIEDNKVWINPDFTWGKIYYPMKGVSLAR